MYAVSTSVAPTAPAAASAPSTRKAYHHGDLRAALLTAATELLEDAEPFSLRAVARRAGVSATAPYRHFADREALESALAIEGFTQLTARLATLGAPSTIDDLGALAVVYVDFALDRPTLFRLMFGQPCDDTNDERVAAASELRGLLRAVLAGVFPDAQGEQLDHLAVGAWGLVHGLAFLHLDGKLDTPAREAVGARVRGAVSALLTPQAITSA